MNGTYGDIFIVEDSVSNHHVHSGGAIKEETIDVQMHKAGNEWRIFHSIYNSINETTKIRVYDQSGQILKTHSLLGKLHRAEVVPDSIPMRKVYFTEHPPYDEQVNKTNIYVIEFFTGDQVLSSGSMSSRYNNHSVSGNDLKVTTINLGQNVVEVYILP